MEDLLNFKGKLTIHKEMHQLLVDVDFNKTFLRMFKVPREGVFSYDYENGASISLRSSYNFLFIAGLSKHYMLDENLVSVSKVYGVAQDFPYARKVSRLLRYTKETVLQHIWKSKSQYDLFCKFNHLKMYFISGDVEDVKFNLYDLAGIFYVWASGAVVSVFIFEIMFINLLKT